MFVQQVVVEESDPSRSSLLVVDNRDERIISPSQNSELASGRDHLQRRKLHQRSDREGPGHAPELRPPLFAVRELHARWHQAVLLFTMTSGTGGPCAQWDSYASKALAHPVFLQWK